MNETARTDWLEDARFGLFIHFGLYSIPAGVWNGQRMGRNDYVDRALADLEPPADRVMI